MTTVGLSLEDVRALPAVVDVPTAGRAYGIGARHSYELSRSGDFPVPVFRLGRLLRVRTADLLADLAPDMREAAVPTAALALHVPAATAKSPLRSA